MNSKAALYSLIEQAIESLRLLQSSNDENEQRSALVDATTALEDLAREMRGERSGREMILEVLLSAYPRAVPASVLRTLSGIQEFGRRIRELRVEHGYDIAFDGESYALRAPQPDEATAAHWRILNEARRKTGSSSNRLLRLFVDNVGRKFHSEELAYVAKTSEWARRVRELRTEQGYRIETHHDDPELKPGEYVLVEADPIPASERDVPAKRRQAALERDRYRCVLCGRGPDLAKRIWLEVDHIVALDNGGSNDLSNLRTLCNQCHAGRD